MGNLFLPETLFTIHADLILAQLEKDAEHNETPYPTELLRDTSAQLRSELHGRAKHKMGTLGFDADYLLYLSPLFPELTQRLGGDRQKLAPFCLYYYKRAFLKQPREMSHKIAASLKAFYQAECPLYEAEKKGTALARNYSASVKLLRPLAYRSEPLERYQGLCVELAKEKHVLKPSWLGRGFYTALRRSYLPGLILAIALAVGICLSPKLRPDLGLFTAIVILPFAYNFGTSFTVSVIHTLGIRRYIFSQQSFALLAQFLALALLLEMLARLIRRFAHLSEAAGKKGAPQNPRTAC